MLSFGMLPIYIADMACFHFAFVSALAAHARRITILQVRFLCFQVTTFGADQLAKLAIALPNHVVLAQIRGSAGTKRAHRAKQVQQKHHTTQQR